MNAFYIYSSLLATLFLSGCNSLSPAPNDNEIPDPWTLVWSDEFAVAGLPDSTKWNYDIGGHGWGNNELQYYTEKRSENARIEDGILIIEARKDYWMGHEYTSARLVTRGNADWLYGRFEIKAKLPGGRGTWPAVWMLPRLWEYGNLSWPDNGEIDIMEYVGYDPGIVHGTIHTKKFNHAIGTQIGRSTPVPFAETGFHLYTLEWSADSIMVGVDDLTYFVTTNDSSGWEAWPFDRPFHLIMNLAVGGSWGGAEGVDPTIWPQRLEVDYVRIYKKTPVTE